MYNRFTRKQKELLARCGEFVLAGEWPWGELENDKAEKEKEMLRKAIDELKDQLYG